MKAFAKPLGIFYCVLSYITGETFYEGNSLYGCALALEPGTVYGTGATYFDAERQARQRMESARQFSQTELVKSWTQLSLPPRS